MYFYTSTLRALESVWQRSGKKGLTHLGEHAVAADTDDAVQVGQRQRLQQVPRVVGPLCQHNLGGRGTARYWYQLIFQPVASLRGIKWRKKNNFTASNNDPTMTQQLSNNDPTMNQQWTNNDPAMIQQWSNNDPTMIQQWSNNEWLCHLFCILPECKGVVMDKECC